MSTFKETNSNGRQIFTDYVIRTKHAYSRIHYWWRVCVADFKLICWSLLDQCVTPVGVCWHWLEFVFTWLNMLNRLNRVVESEQCEMIFQQTTSNSDVIWCGHEPLPWRCFNHGLFHFIRHLFRWRMTLKDINNHKILIVVTGSFISSPVRLTPSTLDVLRAARCDTTKYNEVLLITISDAVYTGCGAMQQLSRLV